MFVLLVSHNVFNWRWYSSIAKGRRELRGITKVVNLSLLVTMLSLLVTSVVISKNVFSFLSLTSTFTMRQLHTTVAYLALLIVSAHIGLHWKLIMGIVRTRLSIVSQSIALTASVRMLALLGAALGIYSLFEAKVGQKLLMRQSLDFGDLHVSTLQSFGLVHVWGTTC